jgi:energy-coupling factor transporter transmembrane protein EcfT
MESGHLIVLCIGLIGSMAATNPTWLLAAALLLALALLPGIRLAQRWIWLPPGLVMGGFGGAFLALDSLLKGVAQSEGGAGGFLPVTGTGWALFTFSFFGAAAALGMTQWAYAKQQPPTATIAAYDAAYVALPILILPVAQGHGASIDTVCLAGLGIIVAGLFLIGRINRNRGPRSKRANTAV